MGKKTLKRTPGKRSPKERMFILTEGEVTEVEYLRYLCNAWGLPKELVAIEKSSHTDPKGIVDEAVERKRFNVREARRGRATLIDHWWAVLDTEGRPQELAEAIQKAQSNGVLLALSDPSIEFWLRLHFGYTTRQYNTESELIKELREEDFLPSYHENNKHPDMTVLAPLLPTAIGNARKLRRNCTAKGRDSREPIAISSLMLWPSRRKEWRFRSIGSLLIRATYR